MLDFDGLFVQRLSTGRASLWLSQGMGTTLAFVTANSAGEQEVRVLNLLGFVCHKSSDIPSRDNQWDITHRDVSASLPGNGIIFFDGSHLQSVRHR